MSTTTLTPAPAAERAMSPTRLVWMCAILSVLALAALSPHLPVWSPVVVVAVSLAAAWVVRRQSLVTSLYLVQLAVYFGFAPLIVGSHWGRLTSALAVAWALGVTLGTLVFRRRPTQKLERSWVPPGFPHFVVGLLLLGIQAALTLSSRSGYKAQITTGQTTPTGIAGLLSSISPTYTLLIFITALSSKRRVGAAMVLTLAQGVVLALSGFRGIGFTFILAVVYVAAILLPKDSAWRRQRLIVVVPALAALIIGTFVIGAQVKNRAANEQHVASSGTQLFGLNQAVKQVATRLDYGYELSRAVTLADDHNLRAAVNLGTQIQAGVPRFLWPGKPPVDYGQQVSVAAYSLRYGQSSSFLTDIGDQYVNFKGPGVVIGGLLLGLAMCAAERAVRSGRGLPSMVFAAALGYSALTGQATIILTTVGVVRAFVFTLILWVGADWFRPVRHEPRPAAQPAAR